MLGYHFPEIGPVQFVVYRVFYFKLIFHCLSFCLFPLFDFSNHTSPMLNTTDVVLVIAFVVLLSLFTLFNFPFNVYIGKGVQCLRR